MSATSHSSQTLVIDSNIGLWSVLPILQGNDVDAPRRVLTWLKQGIRLAVPEWWTVECVSGIRMSLYAKRITTTQADAAIESLFMIEVQTQPIDLSLCRAALNWASRLQQRRAYDALYLALAERMQTEFWTADKRLANAAQQLGVTWVHWIGES
ncbi:MAG TPA: type II toxin-antitoxin system VapC family toxin [Chloroflexia bacterium]